ncbi:ABC transporter ATP-binding protein [Nonomuraea sp. MG754425]|uniref:ABC transporter ATP-binding protein n=1 Tax=Nonomuraea sp. MG754425 TaxID=2570319 RepID=UPI001F2E4B53|nr:ABC transporter ATP-binding protein [Nonomuraea sp. MG754425]
MRLLPLAGAGSMTAMLGVLTLSALTGPALALLTGELVTQVQQERNAGWALGGLLGGILLSRLVRPFGDVVLTRAGRRIDGAVRAGLRRTALAPRTITHLEEAEFADDALRAGEIGDGFWVRSSGTAAYSSLLLTGRLLAAAGSAFVLAAWFPWLALFLLAASLFSRAVQRRQWTYFVNFGDRLTGGQRRLDYLDELAAGPATAKEIRLFGLADWVVLRRAGAHLELRSPMWALRRSLLRRQGLAVLLSVVCGGGAFMVLGLAAADGSISVATLTTCLVAAFGVFEITYVGSETFDIEYGKGAVQAADRLTARYGSRPAHAARAQAGNTAPEIRFENVHFHYPGSTRPVLSGLDLTVGPGEVLAVVGVNGAGKTTFTKLLAGLYEPAGGRILIDDHDLAEYDIDAWRRRLSVVYQDFLRYPATARDNIAFGAVECPADDDAVTTAVRRAGAEDVLSGLDDGLDTQLWRTGSGGRDLSGGQWQKLAIARALYSTAHGRELIILDEPTAHLDVSAEIQFFEKVVEGARAGGASVVIISHRLSTVRDADRIVVLEDGRIGESGTHADLLARGRTYARLWNLQAARFEAAAS